MHIISSIKFISNFFHRFESTTYAQIKFSFTHVSLKSSEKRLPAEKSHLAPAYVKIAVDQCNDMYLFIGFTQMTFVSM